jgi:hydrogenase nickel incorporation protein HypB
MERVITKTNVLSKNAQAAEENRERFRQHGLAVFNMMSAPGSGKTTLLEKTLHALAQTHKPGVIEGDLQTTYDADRIHALGIPVFQINTVTSCHLDARMVSEALNQFPINGLDLLFIENVGNMICPAAFDLGESKKIVLCSLAEGADKPKKYPVLFQRADCIVINKIDLLPLCPPDELDRMIGFAREVNPTADLFPVSCRTGEGIPAWLNWIERKMAACAEERNVPGSALCV